VRTPARQPLLLYCGRLDKCKGVALLIRAFARLSREFPAARLRIAGRGDERPSLESLARSLGLGTQTDFLGWKTPTELDPFLAEAWASVVPSLWAEPQGLVALEAIIRGVPVITSSAGGLGEIVEHGVSGLLFPNGDEAALLEHLRAIVSGTVFPQHTLAEEVVQHVAEDFSVQKHVRRMRQIFAEVI